MLTRARCFLGKGGPLKDKLPIASIKIDETIHDYLGVYNVKVHYRP